jgi:predicted membrane protein
MGTEDSIMSEGTRSRVSFSRLIIGVGVIALGLAWTLDNFHIRIARDVWYVAWRYWPLALVAIGIANIAQAKTWTGYAGGLIWLVAGAWLLGRTLGIIHVSIWAMWPLALVAFGGWILLNGIRPPGTANRGVAASDDTIGAIAVMSGVKRRTSSRDFRGGDLIAVMGGAVADLRDAAIASGEAQLEVFAMWGGIEIFVPEGWAVEVKVFPFMGGVEDRTERPTAEVPPRLVVRGLVIMGGVEIKH